MYRPAPIIDSHRSNHRLDKDVIHALPATQSKGTAHIVAVDAMGQQEPERTRPD